MAKRTIITILSFFLVNYIIAQPSRGFVLNGRINGLRTGSKIYLIRKATKDTIGVSIVKNKQFVFKGNIAKGTEYYYFILDSSISKFPSHQFLLVNNNLSLECFFPQWPKVKLQGSIPQEEYLQLMELWKKCEPMKKNDTSALDERNNAIRKFIYGHLNSLYIPDLIRRMDRKFNLDERITMYNRLGDKAKNSYFGILLFHELDLAKKRLLITQGSLIPDFCLTTVDGIPTSVRELVSKNSLTLVDFWASWCGACRAETANLRKVYEAFKNKGFNIIGVALNDTEENWKKAIEQDSSTWVHGRDVENSSYKIFDITAIPSFALVNKEGRLLAFSCPQSSIAAFGPIIRGDALLQTIDALLEFGSGCY